VTERHGLWSIERALSQKINQTPTTFALPLRQQGITCIFTSAARFSTDAAVLMHFSVLRAFLTTDAACACAYLKHIPQQFGRRFCLSRKHPPGRNADIGTIQVVANALDEHSPVLFLSQTRISTGCAGLSTGKTLFDTADQSLHVISEWPDRMTF